MKKAGLLVLLLTAMVCASQAAIIYLSNTPTGQSTNGFYYFSDGANWEGGIAPVAGDTIRIQYSGKLYMTGNQSLVTYTLFGTTPLTNQIAGSGTLSASTYFIISANQAAEIRDSVDVVVSNRVRMSGVSALNLYDNSRMNANSISFDAIGTQFAITLNGNSAWERLVVGGLKENIAEGSKFVLNNISTINASTLTAQELNDGWLVFNTRFYLNDSAAITLQTDAANATNIASYIADGKILINGSSNAVSGVDYTYDAGTGVLKASPYKSSISLIIISN